VTDKAALSSNDEAPRALDVETRAALEWPALLSALGGLCTSAPGKARALALEPLAELETARARNQVVSELLDLDRLGLWPQARAFPDVSEAVERAARGARRI
jgi:dsDNA-specific endonuclease/ATPase MutS2